MSSHLTMVSPSTAIVAEQIAISTTTEQVTQQVTQHVTQRVTEHVTEHVTEVTKTIESHHESVSVVAVLPNTQRMVTSSNGNTLCLSDLTTRKVLKRLVGHSSDVTALAVSRDGKFIASCDITGGIIPWDGEGLCLINNAQGTGFAKTKSTAHNGLNGKTHNGTIAQSVALQLIASHVHQSSEVHISLDFSADGKTLVGAGGHTVRFWSTATWKEHHDAVIHLDAVIHCVRYSSSGERLAIATENNICVYNTATRQRIKTLKGHSGGTFTLTWTLQGTYLLSGGGKRDPTVRMWEAVKGDEIETFRGHTDKISNISVNDSNTIITSASSDGSIRLWPFPKSNVLDVAAGAFCVTFFSGGNDQKISQWVLPSTGLVSTKTQEKVTHWHKTSTLTLIMEETAYTIITTGGKLTTVLEIFTRYIKANVSDYVCYAHRSIIYTRMGDWECALKDAIKSISIQKSLIGYMAKAIAHYGLRQIREANIAFDLALRFATGDSATHHLLVLIRAIAIFNTNAYDDAIAYVNDMAEVSHDADLLICQVVQVYFYAEMALAASKNNNREKAITYINAAIEIANSCFLQTMDFSVYMEFVVVFGWDLKSLWQTVRKYKCLILARTCNIEALEYYVSLMEDSDKAQKASLRAWFAEFKHAGCMTAAKQAALSR
ncbi:WD40-repeat-containing domain protein [Suillus americanus]|nr:WD40-repeat-containing domain protein [Suillus americanus]